MSMFYNNPLIDKKFVSSVQEFLENQRKEENLLPKSFLEEAKKASVALSFCKTLEDKTMVVREFFNIAVSKHPEPVSPEMMSNFSNLVENYSKTV
jgi:F0F1-type ATP synthase delta subunit